MNKTILGHPVGLFTLFFTEMWERFSYYGGRALLILYMTAEIVGDNPGLGLSVVEAGALYGLYTALVYMTNLPGGWIADKFLGARNAVFYGGIIIAAGNFLLAAPLGMPGFYGGLVLVMIGTGLLKPNVSTMVGSLYERTDARRDSAFSIFYMGINLGAFLAPLVAGYFGQRVSWQSGFLVVGIGMILGLIQYKLGAKFLGDAGKLVHAPGTDHAAQKKALRTALIGVLLVAGLLGALHITNVFALSITRVSNLVGVLLVAIPFVYFGYLFSRGGFDKEEKQRIVAIIVFYLAAALFWSAFEQAGSTLNLFADRYTNNSVLGWNFPSTWWQSVNALWIILLAPVFAWLWIRMHKAGKEPSTPVKFAIGLLLVGVGFLVLVPAAARLEAGTEKVGIIWLLMTYFIHTVGELCLSPVGLSAMTKLAPERIVGQMMGIWFLGASLGNFIGGRVGGMFETFPLSTIFLAVFGTSLAAAIIMFFLVPWMKRLMGDTR
jgi:POT family proton-dependent oligopeptide transporter